MQDARPRASACVAARGPRSESGGLGGTLGGIVAYCRAQVAADRGFVDRSGDGVGPRRRLDGWALILLGFQLWDWRRGGRFEQSPPTARIHSLTRKGRRRAPPRQMRRGSERGQSSANDPVMTSPAGSYVPITTPVGETLLSTSSAPTGWCLSRKGLCPTR
jgi:hypothetical protein